MKVTYYHPVPRGCGNILWPGQFRAVGGRFPAGHPCSAHTKVFRGTESDQQCGGGQELNEFRSRGYWASCFPEGDGITMVPKGGQDAERVAQDIRDCFGWEVEIKRS